MLATLYKHRFTDFWVTITCKHDKMITFCVCKTSRYIKYTHMRFFHYPLRRSTQNEIHEKLGDMVNVNFQ